jgi:hypothetical protein
MSNFRTVSIFNGTPFDRTEPADLPSSRPLNGFAARFDAGVKTGFILVTNWDFKLYSITQLRDHICERKARRSGVRPDFVDSHRMFVCHTLFIASAVPTIALALIQQ